MHSPYRVHVALLRLLAVAVLCADVPPARARQPEGTGFKGYLAG
jgi:hypothetical protein